MEKRDHCDCSRCKAIKTAERAIAKAEGKSLT